MPTRLYVAGLSYETDDESLREAFAGFGDVEFVKVIRDFHSGRSKGFGFVKFSNEESASAAFSAMNGKELDGKNIGVSFAQDPTPGGHTDFQGIRTAATTLFNKVGTMPSTLFNKVGTMPTTLYVAGLSYQTTDESLREAFASFGDVEYVKVEREFATGKSKEFGFIKFRTEESANAALSAMNGKELDGRNIGVSFAQGPTPSDHTE